MFHSPDEPNLASPTAEAVATDHWSSSIVDQDWAAFSADDHAVWDTLYTRQVALLQGRVISPFLDGLALLDLGAPGIPDLARLNDQLEPRTIVLGDKAYDGNAIRDLIEGQGAVPNIPAKSNRKWKPCFSKTLYRERNQVERFFSKLKHFRRIATRYDKLADNFLAMVKLASMRLWLRAYESTA